jgi:hypothetical protein
MGRHSNQRVTVAGRVLDHHFFRLPFHHHMTRRNPRKRLADFFQIGFAAMDIFCNKGIQVPRL